MTFAHRQTFFVTHFYQIGMRVSILIFYPIQDRLITCKPDLGCKVGILSKVKS
jgi:hypothetical protein